VEKEEENERKEQKISWGRKRKVRQESAKQTDTGTEKKREIGNSEL
jgi:hypothetical protein